MMAMGSINRDMTLDDCANWIETEMEDYEEGEDRVYTIVPVWMTDEEIQALTEAEF